MMAVGFRIPLAVLLSMLLFILIPARAQTTDEEIRLIKEKIEQLNERLRELEAAKSGEEKEDAKKTDAFVPDPVTFLNSSGAGVKKSVKPEPPKTFISGGGSFNLTDSDDPRRFNALFSPLFHRQLVSNLHLVLKPEFKVEEDKLDVGLGAGELDFLLNDYITLRGGKLQSPFAVVSDASYAPGLNSAQFLPVLYPRAEQRPSRDILSDLRNMGVGVSGGIPLKFFYGTSITYGVSFINQENGNGVMNFSFSISQK